MVMVMAMLTLTLRWVLVAGVCVGLTGCFKAVTPKELNWHIMETPEHQDCLPVGERERQWCVTHKTPLKNSVCRAARINSVRCELKDAWIARLENNWPFN